MTDDANVTSIESETFFVDINRTMKRNDFRISPDLKRLAYFNWSLGETISRRGWPARERV